MSCLSGGYRFASVAIGLVLYDSFKFFSDLYICSDDKDKKGRKKVVKRV